MTTTSSRSEFASIALRTGVPFGIGMGVFFGLQNGPQSGVVSGCAVGIAFGLSMAAFAGYQKKKFHAMRPELEPEGLVRDGAANHNGRGGWLFLTRKRLVFVPHKINVSTSRFEVPVADITAVKQTRKLLGGQLEVATKTRSHTFVISTRDDWAAALAPPR